ncbi:hypothetical protein CXB51_027574 [Gossypium anomalum]|uniref:DUF6737 domain-containing protein n=1 Tax=Gossypium anomalum TaxID=47600 RepID=A0A8J5YFZ7_9ROSI|nr:hypothetical protein CXB51_027574 [Gossypium anomalum]
MGTLSSLFPLSLSAVPKPPSNFAPKTHLIFFAASTSKLRSKTVAFGGIHPTPNRKNIYSWTKTVSSKTWMVILTTSLSNTSQFGTRSLHGQLPLVLHLFLFSLMFPFHLVARCQPWTITLTGLLVIACSWLILRSLVVTAFATLGICTWWYIFLYSYPKAYMEMIAERRERVENGVEDTFGMSKNQ